MSCDINGGVLGIENEREANPVLFSIIKRFPIYGGTDKTASFAYQRKKRQWPCYIDLNRQQSANCLSQAVFTYVCNEPQTAIAFPFRSSNKSTFCDLIHLLQSISTNITVIRNVSLERFSSVAGSRIFFFSSNLYPPRVRLQIIRVKGK